ncbi:MAG: hypothetical protein WAK61_01220 [Leclercia sp.]
MSTEFLIYREEDGSKMYLTSLPDDDHPLGGIGFQGSHDGGIPSAAGSCPTEEDAKKVIAYLLEENEGGDEVYGIEERSVV